MRQIRDLDEEIKKVESKLFCLMSDKKKLWDQNEKLHDKINGRTFSDS